jgi:hypothetical protein
MNIGSEVIVKRNPKLKGRVVRINSRGKPVVCFDADLFNSVFDIDELEEVK